MLELDDVAVGYTSAGRVLDHVTVSVGGGTCVALLGPNGAGKTTLLRAASRMLPLQHGTIRLDGRDVSRTSPDRLSALGVCHVPEGRGIFPGLTVRDNLALFGHGMPLRTAVDRAVEAFPFIARRLDATAGSLSGGERQMLALTRAWLTRP
jgi:branched-chain amino acid transport system ATP-binding protein